MAFDANESIRDYLERIYKLPDIRPCVHLFEVGDDGILRCARCDAPLMEEADNA